uniref:Uncharacterized protein n=2 Tax=Anguilla anguilla TaxID=7936 RepID=A0A0E9V9X8_ANGAN
MLLCWDHTFKTIRLECAKQGGNYKQGTSIGNKYNLSLHFSNMEINCEQRCVYILFRWLPSRLENYGQLTETLSLEKQVVDST